MAQAFRDRYGEICSLDVLIEAYPTAIEKDVIAQGSRLRYLGTEDLTWNDLQAIVAWPDEDSALVRALRGDDWQWGLPEQLIAAAVDRLSLLVWFQTKDAQYRRNQPKPIPRPGIAAPERIGDQPMSLADLNDFLGWEVAA